MVDGHRGRSADAHRSVARVGADTAREPSGALRNQSGSLRTSQNHQGPPPGILRHLSELFGIPRNLYKTFETRRAPVSGVWGPGPLAWPPRARGRCGAAVAGSASSGGRCSPRSGEVSETTYDRRKLARVTRRAAVGRLVGGQHTFTLRRARWPTEAVGCKRCCPAWCSLGGGYVARGPGARASSAANKCVFCKFRCPSVSLLFGAVGWLSSKLAGPACCIVFWRNLARGFLTPPRPSRWPRAKLGPRPCGVARIAAICARLCAFGARRCARA